MNTTKGDSMNAPRVLAGLALVAAGVAAAFALTTAPTASAYTVDDLTAAGASVTIINTLDGCHDYRVNYHGNKADLGEDCAAAFQGNLDTYYATYIAPPATTSTTVSTPTTTTTNVTTTDVTTTTATLPQPLPLPVKQPTTKRAPNTKFKPHAIR